MRRLRVGIDGRAFSSPAAGVRRYVPELSPALLTLGEVLVSATGSTAMGRAVGPREWDSPEAVALLQHVLKEAK